VARALPALLRAQKTQKRAARVGFDWPDKEPVRAKLLEELEEVSEAESQEEIHEEIGDLLFSAVNLARHYKVDAELALSNATDKFSKRFKSVELEIPKPMESMNIEELEAVWQTVKSKEKNG
jgi:ATP diphosphatase